MPHWYLSFCTDKHKKNMHSHSHGSRKCAHICNHILCTRLLLSAPASPARALTRWVRRSPQLSGGIAVRGAEREVSALGEHRGPLWLQRPLGKGFWGERSWNVFLGGECGISLAPFLRVKRIHPLAILHPFPSAHPQSSFREPGCSPGESGLQEIADHERCSGAPDWAPRANRADS